MLRFFFSLGLLLIAANGYLLVSKLPQARKLRLYGSLKPQLTKLVSRVDLSAEETEEAWDQILAGSDPAAVGALLLLLRAKGETPVEISGMVKSMKRACNPVVVDGKVLDIVGTGGDGADTINISTASVVLAAACGCKVAKAGNRSVSSRCGSADVLETLGVRIELSPSQVAESIAQCGIGFMFAPVNHPAMRTVAPIRKALGVRTAFNILGPMTNAASAQHAVIGVFEDSLVDLLADTLIEVGNIEHAVVVTGCGLDEISPLGPSNIIEIKNTAQQGHPKTYDKKKYVVVSTQYSYFDLLYAIDIAHHCDMQVLFRSSVHRSGTMCD